MRNRRMSGNDFARKGSLTFAIILSVIGMGLSIAAILTPSWQASYTIYTKKIPDFLSLVRYATVSEPLHCVYKFDYDKYSGTFDLEDDNSPVGEVNRHKFYVTIFDRKPSLEFKILR
ncbi:hypothetical protein ANCCAN_06016 [Ancylostoma caninum]|uniref:Uncharacterized protein n=1 Tax=Ancylostoma caninum TaxID=29170 RepID=A0A368GUI6_ANCCA|nr:hypothetical protein ANCCAN_06016 [Ancylostoma caninum]